MAHLPQGLEHPAEPAITEAVREAEEGRRLLFRTPRTRFDLGTFMRAQLFSCLATLRIGMDVLQKEESVPLERMFAHGGLFTTKGVAQQLLASALETPVSVGNFAAEGGAWGIAVLAAFLTNRSPDQPLAEYLTSQVFADLHLHTVQPDPTEVTGFSAFIDRFRAALPVQRVAAQVS